MMNRFVLLLVQGISLSSSVNVLLVEGRKHNNHKKWEEHAQVTGWDESFAAFVPYPPKALEGLPYEKVDELTTLTLDIVVNVAQWDQPLFAILKGIVNRNFRIKTTNHFFIQDGWIYNHTTGVTSECRRPINNNNKDGEVDADGEADAEIQYEPVGWENCTRHCTNGGRYCLNHLDIAGAPLVKESARRMCFDYYLEPGSTVLWDYMDRFETAGCRNDGVDMTACSLEVIDNMNNFNKSNVVDCIYWWGNFDSDHKQQGLQHELHSERVLDINQERATQDLPLFFIDEEQYSGKYNVKDMFQTICDAFPDDEQKPYACEYCTKCHDVRKCLWTLECDGEPLDTSVFHPLPAPTRRPSPYDAQFANRPTSLKGSSKDKSKSNSDGSSSTTGGTNVLHQSFLSSSSGISFVHVGILWGVILGLLVASYFAYKGYKKRRLVKQLADNRLRHNNDRSHAIDALVEAWDATTGDSSETGSLSAPLSSLEGPPSSSASSAYTDYSDDYYDDQTTNTSDGDDDEEEDDEDEEEEDSEQGNAMDGSSSSSHIINSNNTSTWEDEYADDNDEEQHDEECGDSTPLTDYSSLNNTNQGTTTTNDWSTPFGSSTGTSSYSDNPETTTTIGRNVPRKTYDDIASAPTMSGISFTSGSKKSSKKSSSSKDKKDKKDKKKKKKKSKSSSSSVASTSSRGTAAAASASSNTPMNEEDEMKWVLQRAGKNIRKEWTKQDGEFA